MGLPSPAFALLGCSRRRRGPSRQEVSVAVGGDYAHNHLPPWCLPILTTSKRRPEPWGAGRGRAAEPRGAGPGGCFGQREPRNRCRCWQRSQWFRNLCERRSRCKRRRPGLHRFVRFDASDQRRTRRSVRRPGVHAHRTRAAYGITHQKHRYVRASRFAEMP